MKEFVVKFPLGTPLEPLCRKAEELGYVRNDCQYNCVKGYGVLEYLNITKSSGFEFHSHPCGIEKEITMETFMKMNKLTNKYVKVPHNTALKEAVLKHAKDLGLDMHDDARITCYNNYFTPNEFIRGKGWGFFEHVNDKESSITIYDFFALTKEDITPKPQQTRLSVGEIKAKLGIEGDLIVEE